MFPAPLVSCQLPKLNHALCKVLLKKCHFSSASNMPDQNLKKLGFEKMFNEISAMITRRFFLPKV